MEASARTIPLLHHYPVRTDTEELWEEGNVMLGFDAEERLIQKLPDDFAKKIVGVRVIRSRIRRARLRRSTRLIRARLDEPTVARMFGGNAAAQFDPLIWSD